MLANQFAQALVRTVAGARSRGRPLFYTVAGGAVLFACEIKALLADERVSHELGIGALNQVFTYW